MNRIDSKFRELRKIKKKAFIAFITAGYPSLSVTEKLVREFDRIGVDIIELGVPFSDPMADGPVIQEASQFALSRHTQLKDILQLVKKLRPQVNIPIALMTYYNPIFCFGERRFIDQAKLCGVDGVIIPDLPPEEAKGFVTYAHRRGLDTVFFLAPTSTLPRIKFISKASRGFIYYVSLTGVTGARRKLPADMVSKLKLIKAHTPKPVCVGFGVSTSQQVHQIYRIADGVIVGSAIVKKIRENLHRPDLVKRVSNFVKQLIAR